MLTTIEKRTTDIQNALFDWTTVCLSEMLTFIDSHAKSTGIPKMFLFFPLLTTTASLIGTSTCIAINKKWKEPTLLWFAVALKNSPNKSGALNLLSGAQQEIEEMLAKSDVGDHNEEKTNHSSSSITFLLKNCSMWCQEMQTRSLHCTMKWPHFTSFSNILLSKFMKKIQEAIKFCERTVSVIKDLVEPV